jgi:hypothetical protein
LPTLPTGPLRGDEGGVASGSMICARAVPEFSWVRTGGDEAERSGHTFLSATAQQGCLRSGYIHLIATPACRISEYVTGTTAPPWEGHRHLAVSSPPPPAPANPAALSALSRIKVLVSPPCQVKSFDLLKGQRFVIWAFAERSPRFGVKGWETIAREEISSATASTPTSASPRASPSSSCCWRGCRALGTVV